MLKHTLASTAVSFLVLTGFPSHELVAQDAVVQSVADERLAGVSLPPRLARVLRDYESAWQSGNEEALAQLFVEDGLVPGRQGWIRGRDAIRDKYRDSHGDLRLRALAFSAGEKAAFIVGAYGYGDEAAVRDQGNFILALERDSPESPWRIAADLDRGIERPD